MERPQHSQVEQRVLKRITPGSLPKAITETVEKAKDALKGTNVILGGSTAKNTHLADHDVDIFVQFSKNQDNMVDMLEEGLKKAFKNVERIHGSRDYFHVQEDVHTFEFIPVLKITSWKQAKNVTDMSPLHVQYVQEKSRKTPWITEEIRLTKQFCKAAKVYGAESYIGGFSGHVVELLNIHFGGFRELLKAAAAWDERTVIDPGQQLKNPAKELNKSKLISPLVIVDPLQPDRNSAAALTQEKYAAFREAAKAYLHSPSEEYFLVKPLNKKEFQKQHPKSRIIEVITQPGKGKHDVMGAKCHKVFEYFTRQLRMHEFFLHDAAWEFLDDKAILLFAVEDALLSKEHEIPGPPLSMKDDVVRFKKKHTRTHDRDERVYAIEKRTHTDPLALIQHLCTDPYVLSCSKEIKIVT